MYLRSTFMGLLHHQRLSGGWLLHLLWLVRLFTLTFKPLQLSHSLNLSPSPSPMWRRNEPSCSSRLSSTSGGYIDLFCPYCIHQLLKMCFC